jgi:radical SAM protein with 4Fe4S-binding SPASM domain
MTEHRSKPAFLDVDFAVSPFIAIWEITRACALRCVHCRAEAIPNRNPNELTWEQGTAMLREIKSFHPTSPPLVVFTGGDPTLHPDLLRYIKYSDELGLRAAVTPSATPNLTKERILEMKSAGLTRMAISIDGKDAATHDGFRKQAGSFDHTLKALRWAVDAELTVQVNTTISKWNINDIDAICELMRGFGLTLWAVFFLVPTGRGEVGDIVSPEQHEQVFNKLYDLQMKGEFDIKTTAAPAYRRVVMQRQRSEGRASDSMRFKIPERRAEPRRKTPTLTDLEAQIAKKKNTARILAGPGKEPDNSETAPGATAEALASEWKEREMMPGAWKPDSIGRAARGVNDANGFVFVDHVGNVHPSGFMPYPAGNVKTQSIIEIYRNSSIFRRLRDFKQLHGKCRMCEFRDVCGGSRSRSFGVTGDPMASEPYCTYVAEPLRNEPVDWLSAEMLTADMAPWIAKYGEV